MVLSMKSLLHAVAPAACILLFLSSGAMAARPDEAEEAVAAQGQVAPVALEPEKTIPLPSAKPLKGSSSLKSQRPGMAPAKGQKGSTKGTKDRSKSPPEVTSSAVREYKVKGYSVTVHSDAQTGVEFYCRKIRKRLWINGEGWVIRSMPSCF
ncbi:hypothetical protein JH26_28150 [Microvirga sp. BSC39]|nr:hypothetical protein JH26_28150 [Microvirga sp. BSC39]